MCGIVGCISKKRDVAPVLLNSLKRLEYRGYDSVGIATLNNNELNIKKGKGEIDEVDGALNFKSLQGQIGIGHTRWATTGDPNTENSHPHMDSEGKIAIVHNGIIENYKDLKEKLVEEGYKFTSDTDSEVIVHIIEDYMKKNMSLENALIETVSHLKGSYAIGAISSHNPNQILAVANESPLVVGFGEDEYFIASDMPAFLEHTKRYIVVEENEIVILSEDGILFKDLNGKILKKKVSITDLTVEMAEKAGYPHFMLKEIHEQGNVVKNALLSKKDILEVVKKLKNINRICFVACGTSYHAALTGKYLFEQAAKIPTDVILASEFQYSINALNENTLTIFITQSGETADTLEALKLAKEKKSKTLAIVNVLGSKATREADYVIYTKAGYEIGVAATKTYISQLVSIYILVAYYAKNFSNNQTFSVELFKKLEKVPDLIDEVLEKEDELIDLSVKYKYPQNFFYLGRGLVYPTALEGALKLKEITYIHAEGYASGELKHGPLALIDYCVPVVVLAPKGSSYSQIISNMNEVIARGADVIAISSEFEDLSGYPVRDLFKISSDVDELLAPLVYVIPLQLISYYVSVFRGLNPDKPRNLAKCVTVR